MCVTKYSNSLGGRVVAEGHSVGFYQQRSCRPAAPSLIIDIVKKARKPLTVNEIKNRLELVGVTITYNAVRQAILRRPQTFDMRNEFGVVNAPVRAKRFLVSIKGKG